MRLPDPLLEMCHRKSLRPGTQTRQSGQVESLMFVGSTPTLANHEIGPVVQRQRRLAYIQETVVRLHPGSLAVERCSAAHNDGPVVQWEDACLASKRSGFDSRWVHFGDLKFEISNLRWKKNSEGSRIRLAGPHC